MGDSQLIQEPSSTQQWNPLLDQRPQESSREEPLNISALRFESSPAIPCANCGFSSSSGSGSLSGSGCTADHSNSGSGSHKRPLPLSTSSPISLLCPGFNDSQPETKKLFLDQNDDSSPSPADHPPQLLPEDHYAPNPFLLRRCVSDPYHAPPAPAPVDSLPGSGSGISSNTYSSPQNVIKTNPTTDSLTPCSAPLPPRPPPFLRRCFSDPISAEAGAEAGAGAGTALWSVVFMGFGLWKRWVLR